MLKSLTLVAISSFMTFAQSASANMVCADIFASEAPGFLDRLVNQTATHSEVATLMVQSNLEYLRTRSNNSVIPRFENVRERDVTDIVRDNLFARKTSLKLSAEISHYQVALRPHLLDVASYMVSISRQDDAQGISDIVAAAWFRESLEAAAAEKRPLTFTHLIEGLRQKHRRGGLPNLSSKEIEQFIEETRFARLNPLYSDDVWSILREGGVTNSDVLAVGGLSAVARYTRTHRGTVELQRIEEVLMRGLRDYGYDASASRDMLIAIELQGDTARAYFRARGLAY